VEALGLVLLVRVFLFAVFLLVVGVYEGSAQGLGLLFGLGPDVVRYDVGPELVCWR
jgi:hypothetical protein